jgi:hypothetical protein
MPRSWQLLTLSMIAHLAAANADSMPAGSDKQLAAIIAHCRGVIDMQQTALDAGSYDRTLANRALVNTLLAMGALHKVLRHSTRQQIVVVADNLCRVLTAGACTLQAQPMTPLVAAAVLHAVQALIADAVQTGKPPEANWHRLHTVNIIAYLPQPVESLQHLLCRSPSTASLRLVHVAKAVAALPAGATGGGRTAERAGRQWCNLLGVCSPCAA